MGRKTRRDNWRVKPHTASFQERRAWQRGVLEVCKRRGIGLAQRDVVDVIVQRWFDAPKLPVVYIGFGGRRPVPGSSQRPPPKPGLAELSGRSRRTVIRARHSMVTWGLVKLTTPGGGRGKSNAYQLGNLTGDQVQPVEVIDAPAPPGERPPGWQRVREAFEEARAGPDPPKAPLRVSS